MDKKKKIIVSIVTLIFIGVLLGFVKIMLFPSGKSDSRRNNISIITPKVDERKIDRVSKIKEYSQGKLIEGEETDIIKNFSRFEEGEEQEDEDEGSIIFGSGEYPQTVEEIQEQDELSLFGSLTGQNEEDSMSELKQLMELQEQFIAQSEAQQQADADEDYMSVEELESLLNTYNQNPYAQQPATPEKVSSAAQSSAASDSAAMAETRKRADERLSGANKENFSGSKHFQGAGSINSSDGSLDLIPAETVDRTLLVNGSTVAIRTKKKIQLTTPSLLIPSGAVVYGMVSFSANRLFIDIVSYKEGDKLYPLNFKMYDFDGREGVHLGNRTWPKIPSKVAEDVYDFIYQRGTQATAFGGAQDIDLGQAKDIALLSASKEVTKEIFDKRKIMMPKKYHLWLNINPR